MRERTGSELPCMLAHAVLNAVTLTIVPWAGDGEDAGTLPPAAAFGVLALGLGCSALLLRLLPPRRAEELG